ncbi:MAG: ATP-binding protein [Syntrophaceae bacterium]|nr:ATP-binding protein [Syntrophaceae bacterium]
MFSKEMESRQLTRQESSTEDETVSSYKPDEMSYDLEGEAQRRLERYSDRTLKQLGEWFGAKSLTLFIRDNDNHSIICAKQTHDHGTWNFETDEPEDFSGRSCAQCSSKPVFVLRSQFHYYLDLPHRWVGMVTIECRGLFFLSQKQDRTIRNALREFTKNVTILLMDRSIGHLQNCLNQEKKATGVLRGLVSNLSKELYCLSTISNAIVQSHNVEDVLTDALETILPLVRAKLGVIYFPETRQCVIIQSPKSKPKKGVDPWFNPYFESKMRLSGESSGWNCFSVQSVNDNPCFPEPLKAHLASQRIENVLEFSLHHHGELLGLGFLGLQQNQDQPAGARLLMITLNMIGLFLEHISLMGDLERQVKLISKEKLDMEKTQQFLIDHVGRPFTSNSNRRSSTTDLLIDEIERSRNMALLAELASGIAHQIRNPLSNLVYGLHLLQQEHITESEKKELFQTVTERVELMNRMINEFIQYTRIPELKLSVESINDVLKNTLRLFKGWTDLDTLEIITSFDPELPLSRVDIFLINQAFQNIIKNAMEAISRGGHLWVSTRKMKIRHGPEPRLEFAEIVFEDDGPGMTSEEIENAMKPFYSRKESGLGLGLPLVEHIVRLHGGAVTLENRHTGGVRVRVYLPIR